jgi:hypothetical protein
MDYEKAYVDKEEQTGVMIIGVLVFSHRPGRRKLIHLHGMAICIAINIYENQIKQTSFRVSHILHKFSYNLFPFSNLSPLLTPTY